MNQLTFTWDDLAFWDSGEWQVIDERLYDLKEEGKWICPHRSDMFKALDEVPYDKVKVCIMGQDPYPNPKYATGVAFEVPYTIPEGDFPPTLVNIFNEYVSDLHYPAPSRGDLGKWCSEGVLLWNATPSCEYGKPLAHEWLEWEFLTKEIVEKLDAKNNMVFALLGAKARAFEKYAGPESIVIGTSHPSPLAASKGHSPFLGSRIFTTINSKLFDQGVPPINWRL